MKKRVLQRNKIYTLHKRLKPLPYLPAAHLREQLEVSPVHDKHTVSQWHGFIVVTPTFCCLCLVFFVFLALGAADFY
jgi:hypothetical protein